MPALSLQRLLKTSQNLSTKNHGAARFDIITSATAPVGLNLILCWPSRHVAARGLKTPLWKRHPLTLTTCHPKKALLSQEPHAAAAEMCCFLSLTKRPFIKIKKIKRRRKKEDWLKFNTEGLAGRTLGFLPVNGIVFQEALALKKNPAPSNPSRWWEPLN